MHQAIPPPPEGSCFVIDFDEQDRPRITWLAPGSAGCGRWGTAAFLSFWLCGWAVGEVIVIVTLIGLIGQPYYEGLAVLTAFPSSPDPEDVEEIDGPEVESDMGPTFKEQVVKARRGQGVFRSSVLLTETACRVTHVSDAKHLRASHIKPWRDANNSERLDGANGLLLSPHIDHLFDQGYISFSNSEELLVVPEVRTNLLDKWGIDSGTRVGEFNRQQQAFFDYHRANVFKGLRTK